MDIKSKGLLKNTGIIAIGTFASKALVFLLMPLYTAFLSPEQYGIADLITNSANLLMPLACIGICDGIFRFALSSDCRREDVFRTSITILTAVSAVFLILSPLISLIDYFNGYAWLIALYVVSANIHSACAQYVRASDNMKLFSIQGVLNTAIVIAVNILLIVVLKIGLLGYVLSVIIGDLCTSLFLIFRQKLHRDFKNGRYSKDIAKKITEYSIPMIPTTIFWWITNVSDRYMLTFMNGSDVNGLYSAANKIPTLVTLFIGIFNEAWQFSAVKDAEKEQKSEFFGKTFGYFQSLILAVGLFIVVLSKPITKILLAPSYYESWRYIPFLTLASVFSAYTTFMGSVYLVKKKPMMSMVTSLVGAVVNVGLNLLWIPEYGAQGAALATVISYILSFVIRMTNAQRFLKFKIDYLKLLINSILIIGVCLFTVSGIEYSYLYSAVCIVAFLIINAKSIASLIFGILSLKKCRSGSPKEQN